MNGSKSLSENLHEDHESNVTDKCCDIVKRRPTDYKSLWINNEDAKPPEDFRTLSVYATSNDILHPGTIHYHQNCSQK